MGTAVIAARRLLTALNRGKRRRNSKSKQEHYRDELCRNSHPNTLSVAQTEAEVVIGITLDGT